MNYQQVVNTLNALGATRKKNEKKAILTTALRDTLFTKVVQYALDADRTFYMNGVEPVQNFEPATTPIQVFDTLDYLDGKGSANADDKEYMSSLAGSDPALAIILDRITKKDLRCGVGARMINEVVPETVFDPPYQRCSTESKIDRVSYTALAQRKCDGQFAYAFATPHPRTGKHFLSRNGSGYELFGQITPAVPKGHVMVGEMLVVDGEGKILDRQTGNGLMDKFIDGTGDADLASRVRYVVWDLLTEAEFSAQRSSRPVLQRWDLLCEQELLHSVSIVESRMVENEAEARAFYKELRERGEEGAILKDLSETWSYNTSPKLIKLKNVSEADFEIVEALYGTPGKKWAQQLGALLVKTSDGLLVTQIGKGFTDEQRLMGVDWWNTKKGQIITCKFTSVIDDKTDRETKCLDGSSMVETRFNEKTVADTLAYCLEVSR